MQNFPPYIKIIKRELIFIMMILRIYAMDCELPGSETISTRNLKLKKYSYTGCQTKLEMARLDLRTHI